MSPSPRPWFQLPLALLGAVLWPACASTPPPEAARPVVAAEAAPAPALKRAVPAGQIRREDVLGVLSDGPPAFLQRVEVEPVRDRDGRFYGWRVVAVREPAWSDGEVQPGDVVLRVNGKPIENPFQFFDVFQSLAFAPELRIAVDRAGAPRELRYPINDDPASAALPHPAASSPGDMAAAPEANPPTSPTTPSKRKPKPPAGP